VEHSYREALFGFVVGQSEISSQARMQQPGRDCSIPFGRPEAELAPSQDLLRNGPCVRNHGQCIGCPHCLVVAGELLPGRWHVGLRNPKQRGKPSAFCIIALPLFGRECRKDKIARNQCRFDERGVDPMKRRSLVGKIAPARGKRPAVIGMTPVILA